MIYLKNIPLDKGINCRNQADEILGTDNMLHVFHLRNALTIPVLDAFLFQSWCCNGIKPFLRQSKWPLYVVYIVNQHFLPCTLRYIIEGRMLIYVLEVYSSPLLDLIKTPTY